MTGSPADMVNSAKAAGFTGGGLVAIIAIGLAESGGQLDQESYNPPKASNNYTPSYDRGYFQINSVAWPNYDKTQLLTNSAYNGQAAYAISKKGTDFSPWATWTSTTGKRDSFHNESALKDSTIRQAESLIGLTPAQAKTTIIPLAPIDPNVPLETAPGPGDNTYLSPKKLGSAADAVGSVGDAVKAIGGALAKLSDRSVWIRIGEYFAGFVLLLIGLGLVFRKDFVSGAKTAIGAVP